MPEVIEIRYFADFISSKIKSKEISEINILNGRYKKHEPFIGYKTIKTELPLKVKNVQTKGKLLYITFDKEFYMFSTLGLTGGWCFRKAGGKTYEFSKNLTKYSEFMHKEQIDAYIRNATNHLNVEFKTKIGSLYYFDYLSFGSLKIVNLIENLNKKLKTIGPDIMDIETSFEIFQTQIQTPKNLEKEIGIVLMDQKIISGIGNYLRSDILYISKINPFRKVKTIDKKELKTIYDNCKILTWGFYDKDKAIKLKIIKKNIKLPSDYNRTFYIYNESEDMLGNKVLKTELYEGSQKRFIYYVPKIQK